MSVDKDEALVVSQTMAEVAAKRGGCVNPVRFADWVRTAPAMYHSTMEEAAEVIAALDKHRQQKYMAWMNSKP
jgi:hypothetical protein